MKNYHKTLHMTLPPNIKTDVAKKLIQKQHALDLNHKGIQSASLDLQTLVTALLELSWEKGFIKYDPFDETIVIKQLNQHPPILQYNPYRDTANRPANGQQGAGKPLKRMDFLAWETFPDNEYYLIWQAPSGLRYAILVQPAPIVPAHLIIASFDRDSHSQEHYPQKMSIPLLRDMHELQAVFSQIGYSMGFNDWGAGASVNHFHTQAVPKEYLPFIPAIRNKLFEFDLTGQDGQGVAVHIIHGKSDENDKKKYPINTILIESDNFELLFERKKMIFDILAKNRVKFNSIGWQENENIFYEVFFPRGQEALMDGAFNAGYVEMSGMLVMPGKALFDSHNQLVPVQQALHEATLNTETFKIILEKILPYFSK